MANQQSAKGNPASRRMSNPQRAARRQRCFGRSQARKTARRQVQEAQQKENMRRRQRGELTPWEAAKKARYVRRHPVVA